jgi:hypothetical protein
LNSWRACARPSAAYTATVLVVLASRVTTVTKGEFPFVPFVGSGGRDLVGRHEITFRRGRVLAPSLVITVTANCRHAIGDEDQHIVSFRDFCSSIDIVVDDLVKGVIKVCETNVSVRKFSFRQRSANLLEVGYELRVNTFAISAKRRIMSVWQVLALVASIGFKWNKSNVNNRVVQERVFQNNLQKIQDSLDLRV